MKYQADFLGNKTSWIQFTFQPKNWTEISWFLSKEANWIQLIFQRKVSLFSRHKISWKLGVNPLKTIADFWWTFAPENVLIFNRCLSKKLSWFFNGFLPQNTSWFSWLEKNKDVFLVWKSAYFRSFSWPENQLNSARFYGLFFNWILLVFLTWKSTELSLFSWFENQLISAHFLRLKINWIQLVFMA